MRLSLLPALAVALASVCAHADPATLREADALLKSGQPAQAVVQLLPLREAEANNPVFHYLLGIAYLDSGKLNDAIAELKRSLALEPKFMQAKAELGRAYVLNGENLNAYLAFREVRDAKLPPEVLAGIERYIDAAAGQLTPTKKVFGAINVSLGYDTNVNSGTAATSVFLPIFGGVRAALSPSANPQRDKFAAIGGYVNVQQPVIENLDLIGSVGANVRYEFDRDLSAFDTQYASVTAGARYTAGANQLSALGLFEQFNYDKSKLYSQPGVALDWRRLTGGPVELDFNYRYTHLDYNDQNSLRDARRQVFGVALLPSFFGRRLQYVPPMANIYYGTERPRNAGVDNLGYELWGVRAAYFTQLRGAASVAISGGYEERRYGAPDPLFLDTRHDRQIDLSAALIYEIRPTWSVVPSVQWVQSASNIDVYAFRRTIATVTLRKTF